MTTQTAEQQGKIDASRAALDARVREVVAWHFDPATGSPFWLDWADKAGWDPRSEVHGFDDLAKFGHFEDEWLRGGPVRRWVPKAPSPKLRLPDFAAPRVARLRAPVRATFAEAGVSRSSRFGGQPAVASRAARVNRLPRPRRSACLSGFALPFGHPGP